jgi:hypothetical protein
MKFLTDIAIKLLFLFSTMPFLLSEKMHDKFDFRLNKVVLDSLYSGAHTIGEVGNSHLINEASGIVASHIHPHLLYTHNDSGGEAEIYMMDTLGGFLGKITLEDAKNRDWEDIAIGPGEDPDMSYVYVGDIGDNNGKRDNIQVYRFPEPQALEEDINIKPEKFTLVYPDGARDAETMMVDAVTGDLLILSKRDTSNVLYRASADQLGKGEVLLHKVMKLPITMAVGGDISSDGKQIAIKNYWVVYYWERFEGESIPEALGRKPTQLPYKPEPQGEAIGFSYEGDRYFTLSENRFRIEPVLYQYVKLP